MKLVIDGTTASNAPAGFYFPEMVMDLQILPAVANTVMAAMARSGTGNIQPGQAVSSAVGVYLPRAWRNSDAAKRRRHHDHAHHG